nr:hypothetical protein [Trinickia violacea]
MALAFGVINVMWLESEQGSEPSKRKVK